MIENFSKRNLHLEAILVDNCCAERQFYDDFFFFQKVEFV